MHYAYSDLATACMHAHMTDVCAVPVMFYTVRGKRKD